MSRPRVAPSREGYVNAIQVWPFTDGALYQVYTSPGRVTVIALQEELGLDVLVHGEPERNDMVQYFAEQLDGFFATQNGWVQSYGTRCVRPPILFGDVIGGLGDNSVGVMRAWLDSVAALRDEHAIPPLTRIIPPAQS